MFAESCLDSSVSSDNDNLYMKVNKLVKADHPENVKRGGVYVYFKEYLPVSCLPNPCLKHSHKKRNSLDTRAVFKEFSEYVNNSGLVAC